MVKLNNKKGFLICLALIGANLLFRVMVIQPQYGRMDSLRKAAVALRRAPVVRKSGIEQRRWEAVASNMSRVIQTRVPHVFQLPEYAGRIAAVIDENQLVLKGKMVFQVGESPSRQVDRYTTVLDVSGQYSGLKQFIADLYNSPELLCINEAHFTRSKEKDGAVQLRLTLDFFFRGNRDD